MIDTAKFRPNTVYVTYIAATPGRVWQALTDPAFTVAEKPCLRPSANRH